MGLPIVPPVPPGPGDTKRLSLLDGAADAATTCGFGLSSGNDNGARGGSGGTGPPAGAIQDTR